MLKDIYFGITLPFATVDERAHSEHILKWLLGTVCQLNYLYLERHPNTPKLYESGVRYAPPDQSSAPPVDQAKLRKIFEILQSMGQKPEIGQMVARLVQGAEVFLDIPNLYARKRGDCNELVPVRVAELWRAGIAASPLLVKPLPNSHGGLTYHVVVTYLYDGSCEDPSLILGMGGRSRAAERREEIRKNHERLDNCINEAKQLIAAGDAMPWDLEEEIDAMGFVPREGFRA